MVELPKDKMIAETVNLLMKYLEVHSQTFEASESVRSGKTNFFLSKYTKNKFVYGFLL